MTAATVARTRRMRENCMIGFETHEKCVVEIHARERPHFIRRLETSFGKRFRKHEIWTDERRGMERRFNSSADLCQLSGVVWTPCYSMHVSFSS